MVMIMVKNSGSVGGFLIEMFVLSGSEGWIDVKGKRERRQQSWKNAFIVHILRDSTGRSAQLNKIRTFSTPPLKTARV